MIAWICTDMEGLAGVDNPQQFDPDFPGAYREGQEHLTADVNAAIAGCFDAGCTAVRILDGHGANDNRGFLRERLDPRATIVWIAQTSPVRWEGLDESVSALLFVGQHSMAGTVDGFYDHTGSSKTVCRFMIDGQEQGEVGQMALYAGHYNVPLVYVSGDEAVCAEMRRLFPHVRTTATKRGTGWLSCDLYPVDEVRRQIRVDVCATLKNLPTNAAWRPPMPVRIDYEFAWSGLADRFAKIRGVDRWHARGVGWRIADARDVYAAPGDEGWLPIVD